MRSPTAAATKQGKRASWLIVPIAKTSKPKIVAAKGFPKTEANPPLIADINKIRRLACLKRNILINWSASDAAIYSAVPSRPAEPPNK